MFTLFGAERPYVSKTFTNEKTLTFIGEASSHIRGWFFWKDQLLQISFQPNPARQLLVPAGIEHRFQFEDSCGIAETLADFTHLPRALGAWGRLKERTSPIGLEFLSTGVAEDSPVLYPTFNHGHAELMAFTPDQHFRGQFKVHPQSTVILTSLLKVKADSVVEAIDLRSDSLTYGRTDALIVRPDPGLAVRVPAGVAYRLQGRKKLTLRLESQEPTPPEELWLGTHSEWPKILVPLATSEPLA